MPDLTPIIPSPARQVVIVTGPAGAGRSTAIHALEDMGFEAIDNLPLGLVGRLLDGRPLERRIALGIDSRTRGFSVAALRGTLAMLEAGASCEPQLLYVDCRPEVLVRRFSETRRRHPSGGEAQNPDRAIAHERELLAPLREDADMLIDTSDLSPHDLRAALARWFDDSAQAGLAVSVQSFSYRRGVPQDLDLVFDVRFLANPHWVPELRPRDGRDAAVARHVAADPSYAPFYERLRDLLLFLLPAYRAEGKAHLALGFGCTGGQHRSVTLAEAAAKTLAEAGWQVSIRHRELERRGDGVSAGNRGRAS